ncbi:ABC transporter permease [Brachybacterium sacelli]|uniref:Transport permease protein n=2 Tax=Brachybacterium sacelli TaxID=173364 RepID=A0ABS4WVI9_9MICO|nr:ABC transporter permease [Brachybacterium sacelli]MBP2380217.1 teichoic acid transport system permease protein [Brachybacterium sacelli]
MAGDSKVAQQVMDRLEARGLQAEGLFPVGVRPGLGEYLGQLWQRRHFIWTDARHRVATQNSRNHLGSVWLVLRPLLDAALYFVVFGLILDMSGRTVENFAAYVIIGILMFRSTMRSISQGTSTLQTGRSMIRAFSFPRASLPIASELRDMLQMQYTIGVVLVMIMVIPPHELPQTSWLLIIPIYVLQFVLNLGINLFVSRLGFLIPDVSQLMTVVGRFLMYGSGVIFPIERFLDHPTVNAVVQFNPIYQMIKMYRQVLMDGGVPPLESWLILGGWAVGLLIIGFLFFWRGEESYGGGQ